jgi:pimeloyl-ACP methyl ester carboxylesterase
MRDVYYSAETSTADLLRFAPLFQSESRRALLDLTLLAMRIGRRRPALPVLVVGGEADAVFPAAGPRLHRRALAGRGGGDSCAPAIR